MIDSATLRTYRKCLAAGYLAADSLRTARIVREWSDYAADNADESDRTSGSPDPDDGCVRLVIGAEDESYYDVFGEPEAYTDQYGRRVAAEDARKETDRILDRDGVWRVSAQYLDPYTLRWATADSCGMFTGYRDVTDPVENFYIPDLMQSALERMHSAWAEWESAKETAEELAALA
jgi:hypothetical protein